MGCAQPLTCRVGMIGRWLEWCQLNQWPKGAERADRAVCGVTGHTCADSARPASAAGIAPIPDHTRRHHEAGL